MAAVQHVVLIVERSEFGESWEVGLSSPGRKACVVPTKWVV
jgi:hypothetical protein